MSSLNGKVAIVTGASKGIGASIAKTFAAAGASVVVNYASSREGADKVVAEIESKGGRAVAVQGDVSKRADVERIFAETKKAFGTPNVLVNNAGVFAFGPVEEVTEDEYRRQFDINVLGTILATGEAVKNFGPEGGSIINISSVVATNPMANAVVYSATKGAVDTIAIGLAKELAPRKIRVNTLSPGGVETEGSTTLGMIGSELEQQIIAQTPLGRIGQPEDIAQVALFLASDASGWLTGERITAAGGLR